MLQRWPIALSDFQGILMAQQVKDPTLSLLWLGSQLWCGFDPWPGNILIIHMLRTWPKSKKKKKKKKSLFYFFYIYALSSILNDFILKKFQSHRRGAMTHVLLIARINTLHLDSPITTAFASSACLTPPSTPRSFSKI